MDPRLRELLSHPDPALQQQGVELVRALGLSPIDDLIVEHLDADGTLWPPPGGWSVGLLILLSERAPSAPWRDRIRHFYAACPEMDRLLPKLAAALPGLGGLDISWSDVTDLTPLASLPLQRLRLQGCTQIVSLDPLASLSQLVALDLSRAAVPSLEPLERLATLRSLGLEQLQTLGGLARLPGGIEALWLSETPMRERLTGRPLRFLSVNSIGELPEREAMASLASLRLDRGALAPLARWPVRRLRLRGPAAPGALARIQTLRWVQLEAGHHLHDWPPGLQVIDGRQATALPKVWPDGVRPSPRLLRVASLPDGHEFRRVWWSAARHWRSVGYTVQLRATRPPDVHARRIIQMHRRFAMGLQEARQLLTLLGQGQLVALSPQQAVDHQTLLAAAGAPSRREPWDGAV